MMLIEQWIHSETDRQMLVMYLLDGKTIEQVAEAFNLSTVQTQAHISKARKQLFLHI